MPSLNFYVYFKAAKSPKEVENLFDKNIFKSIIHIAYSALFALFFVYMFFGLNSGLKTFSPNQFVILAIAAVLVLIGTGILFLLKKFTGLKGAVIRGSLVVFCFIAQFYLFWKTSMTPGWDANIVVRSAIDGFPDMLYYSKLPNNLLPAIIMRGWVVALDFLTFIAPLKRLIILNLIFVNCGLLFMYLAVKRVWGLFAADKALLISIPLIAFSPWLATPYTDTMGIFFPSFILYCLVRGAQSNKVREKQLFIALSGLAAVFSYYIKPTALIVLIAAVIAVLVSKKFRQMFNFTRNIKKNSAIALIIGCAVGYILVSIIMYPANERIQNEHPNEIPRGLLYYLDHGIRSRNSGTWSGDNYEWTAYNIADENYEQMAWERITDLVQSYGFSGMAEHFYKKILWTGTDGVFAYGMEGAFYTEPQDPTDTLRGFLQNYVYHESYFFQNVLAQFLQALWLIVCFQSAVSFLYSDKNEFSFLTKLAVGGLFLYLMLFENRSRYIFLYTPVIIFATSYKADNFIKAITEFAEKRGKTAETSQNEEQKNKEKQEATV